MTVHESKVKRKAAISAVIIGILIAALAAVGCYFAYRSVSDSGVAAVIVVLLALAGALLVGVAIYSVWLFVLLSVRYQYKIVVDPKGVIVKADNDFRRQFPQVVELSDVLSHIKKNKINTLRLKTAKGEFMLACLARVKKDGRVVLKAGDLNAYYSGDGINQNDSMSSTFDVFLTRGRRVLVGNLCFENLESLRSTFGTEFVNAVRSVLIDKITEQFVFVYDSDSNHVGILYPDGKKMDDILQGLNSIMEFLNQPVRVDDNLVNVSVKAGFAICDGEMENIRFSYCTSAADAALNRAEQEKEEDFYVYHESQRHLYAKFFMRFDIIRLLEKGAFEMHYQPQVAIGENRVVGFEALFRIKPDFHLDISPADIVAYAEKAGYMVQLGNFIFDRSMKFAKSLEGKGISVSLNISPVQLMQAEFVENFLEIYRKYDLKPNSICIEIPESLLMTTFEETLEKLQVLRDNGIGIHLDDFGTHYSSLPYLDKLPITAIKVDRSFINGVPSEPYYTMVVKAIIGMTKALKHTCIAEGVETEEQAEQLKALGCDQIQGWLISKAMREDEVIEFLNSYPKKKSK